MYGKHHSKETRDKIRINHTGKTWEEIHGKEKAKILRENQRLLMLNGLSRRLNTPERIEELRKYMLNGGAVRALRGLKNPSKPEVLLREMVKKLYPNCEFQHGILNFAVDVVIPDKK